MRERKGEMKTRIHGMLGTNHSWAFTQQAIARAMMGMEGQQVFLKSTNGLEHFPEDLKRLLLPGYHSHPSLPELAFLGPDGTHVALDRQKLPEDVADANRPYDLELAYTILYQIPRRFFQESACKMVIWNFESSVLPPGWQMYHRGVDYILPSSQYSSDIFLKNGVPASKLAVVPHGVYREMFHPGIPPFKLHTRKRVKFLHNAIPHHRKLHERVIDAYLEAFMGDDDVCLVMKTKFLQPSQDKPFEVDVRAILERKMAGRSNPPEIEVITSFVPDIGSLYTACDAVVSMSSCEGFCLLPQTEIDTSDGPTPIGEILPGATVFTHNGIMKTVSGVTKRHYDGQIVVLRRMGDDAPFAGTPEHSHLVVPKNNRRFHRLRKAVEERAEQPIWMALGQVRVGDLVAVPKTDLRALPIVHHLKVSDHVPGLSTDGHNVWFAHSFKHGGSVSLTELAKDVGCSFQHVSRVLNGTYVDSPLAKRILDAADAKQYRRPCPVSMADTIMLTPEFGFLCGLYISEGSPIADGNATHFASHIDETLGRDAVLRIAKQLGLHAVQETHGSTGSAVVTSAILTRLLTGLFGHGAKYKLIPSWLWNSPAIFGIIGGIFYGDGTCTHGAYGFSTSSPRLAGDLRLILSSHGILCHLCRDCRRDTNYTLTVAAQHNTRFAALVRPTKYTKRIDLPNGTKNTAVIENENFFFVPVKHVEHTEYHGMVHNLHIEDDHSFLAGGMATHNCLPLLEALACGPVVIAPRHGGQLDFLDDGNALLVDTGEMRAPLSMQYWTHAPEAVVGDPNTRHCAELMRRVYADPAGEKARVAESAQRTVGKFTWEAAAKQIVGLAEECVAKKAARPAPRKRRVLYVIPYSMAGGGEVWVREAIRRLDRSRYEPSLAFPMGTTPELLALFDDLDVRMDDLKDQGTGNALKCMVESGGYDIVHFYNSLQVYSALLRTIQEGAWHGRLIETVHSELMWPDSMMKIAVRRGVAMIIGVSDTICAKLAKMGNQNVRHLPQRIAWERFGVPRGKAALGEIGCPMDRFTIGTVARLSPEKNIPAVLACAKAMPDALFVIVGDGPQSGVLKGMAAGLGNVVFAGRRTDVERFYAAFDAMLLPSGMEGLPLTIMEAMASGVPVVASKVGAVPELVVDGVSGFVVRGGPKEYVAALDQLRDPGRRAVMSENALGLSEIIRARGDALGISDLYDSLF